MGQLTPIVANRISAGSRSVEYPEFQDRGNDRVWACVLLSEPEADVRKLPAFADPRATTRSARQVRAGSIQMRRGGREATAIPSVIYDVRPAPVAVVKSKPTSAPARGDTLTESDVSNLKAILNHEIASSTLKTTASSGGIFCPGRWQRVYSPSRPNRRRWPRTWRNASRNTGTNPRRSEWPHQQ